jgi:2-C-methyl-D-erythritol 4-phosphate cytidylyltransferase
MKTGVIILAGGVGQRMGQPIPKQFIMLGGKPIIAHVLEKIEQLSGIDKVVITCPKEYLAETRALLAHRNIRGDFDCIEGGVTRQESMYNALLVLDGFDRVIVHEAVRPFVVADDFRTLMDSEYENAIYGIHIPFTVLAGHEWVEGTLERADLVNVQLPQKFDYAKLRDAHERARAEGRHFTEDASLLHHYLGEPVRILEGTGRNIKITEPVDLIIGEAIYDEYVLGGAQD